MAGVGFFFGAFIAVYLLRTLFRFVWEKYHHNSRAESLGKDLFANYMAFCATGILYGLSNGEPEGWFFYAIASSALLLIDWKTHKSLYSYTGGDFSKDSPKKRLMQVSYNFFLALICILLLCAATIAENDALTPLLFALGIWLIIKTIRYITSGIPLHRATLSTNNDYEESGIVEKTRRRRSREKKLVISAIVITCVLFILGGVLVGRDLIKQSEIRQANKTANEGLPMMVDDVTRLESISVGEEETIYTYTLLLDEKMAHNQVLSENLLTNVQTSYCESSISKDGWKYSYLYYDSDGHHLFERTFTALDCAIK